MLVASSRSFGAVNREQFYVSISRGRQRCHVFTDDADLLARRVTDSHERKAAVELQGLRDDLARLGFLPQPQLTRPLKEKIPSPASRFRTVRPLRVTRSTRLTPVQRLVQVAQEVARWLDDKLRLEGLTHKESMAGGVSPQDKSLRPGGRCCILCRWPGRYASNFQEPYTA